MWTAAAWAQPVPTKPPSDEAFAELIQTRLKQIEQTVTLDETAKKTLQETYAEALKQIEAARIAGEKLSQCEQAILHAPNLLEQARAELASLPAERTLHVPAEVTLAELEQAVANRESELTRLRGDLEKAESEPKQRTLLRTENGKQAAALRDQLVKLAAELQTLPAGDDSLLAAARRAKLMAQRRAAEQQLLAIDRETAAHEATTELLPVRRDLAARRVALAEQETKQLQEAVNRRRQSEAERQAQTAKLDAIQAHPAVRRLAQENAALAEARKRLAEQITDLTAQAEQSQQQLAAVKAQSARAREKVTMVGLTNAVGLLLRKQRDTLPNVGQWRRTINARQLTIGESQLALLQLRDRRSELADIEPRARGAVQELAPGAPPSDRQRLEQLVRESLTTQKEYLDALIGDHNAYFEKLVELDGAERRLIDEIEQCARFIDERVLWITSDPALEAADLRHAGDALWWLAGPEALAELGRALAADAFERPALPLLAILVLVPLVFVRGQLRGKLAELGERARRANCYRFVPTLQGLLLAALTAAVWPAAMAYAGWRLAAPIEASELCKAAGAGLWVAARVFWVVEFLRQLGLRNGLAEAHFGWSESAVKALRQSAAWLRLPLLPAVFFVVAMDVQANDRWDGALGRGGFVAAMLLCAVVLHRVLRPGGGVFQEALAERRGSWLDRLKYVWYPAGVAVPLVLAGLAALGYYYTAQQLTARLALTVYLLLGFVLVRSLLLRWVVVSRRKLAIEQARQRRAAQAEAAGEEGASELPAAPAPQRDLAAINNQTRRLVEYTLVAAGLLAVWFVWVDVTPALRFLHEVKLWTITAAETVADKGPDGKELLRTIDRPIAITLASLMLALLTGVMTILAAKNIPGLMEMAVLQHLPFDAGVRYAVATISRYLITIAGIVFACSTIGIGWSKVQWLVAALSVGLGFGLQEIFANFISGLIILFERPIRVGDVITVGEVTGKVSLIRMRATTILDGDRKELIVPNKEFITGRVLNWTLSDQVNRVIIKVGVAYGADTARVEALLLDVAREHPLVLDEPPPRVALEAFGASSLDFVLRCFLPNLDSRSLVIHELHMAIDRAFRAAGIEIAFPQQDVHVRSVALTPAAGEPAAADEQQVGPQLAPADDPPPPPSAAEVLLAQLAPRSARQAPKQKRVA